ncbi:MAG TPA: DUF6049 family protein [Candidatus Nanopelagicales bacterium]|nr:DUF6049 family protein [Candidatus Nanopelagicales bacterium]
MRRRPGPARLAAAAALLGALALTSGAGSASASTPATVRATASDAGVVPVTITGLAPLIPAPGATLVVVGTVTNTASTAVSGVAVRLRLSPTPVRSRGELEEILAGAAGRTGVAVPGTRTDVAPTLEPGATAPFRITVPIDSLGLPAARAEVAVLGVESLGDVADDGQGPLQTGLTRTFLPWFPVAGQVSPTPVVWLYPLTSAPARAANGVFLDDHLAAEIGPRGRLTRILDAAEAAPSSVSWVVDPALLQSLQDMADGYEVATASGVRTPGTGQAAAQTWLARLASLTTGAEVTAAAYASPDVVALHRAGLDVDIALAGTTERDLPSRVLGRPVETGLAWPPLQLSDDGTLDVLRASGVRAVVLSAASLPPSPPVTYTPSGSVDLGSGGSPLRAVASDPAVSGLVAAPPRAQTVRIPTPVEQRQQALAEIAVMSLELPSTPRTLVIAPQGAWSAYGAATRDLVTAVSRSPWSQPERLGALLAAPASEVPRGRTDYPASARAAELPQSYLRLVAQQRTALAALRSVAPDAAVTAKGRPTTGDLEEALTRAESAAWRTDPVGGRRLLATAATSIGSQTAAVHVLTRAPVTLPGDEGTIPITIANDLDRPARVGVRLTGTPTTRFEAADVDAVTLQPGQKQTVEVRARVVGTGSVDVAITLLTPEGAPFGEPVTTEVRSAAYARAAQWVVGGLFGILVVLLGINFVRRRRSGPERPADQGAAERVEEEVGDA